MGIRVALLGTDNTHGHQFAGFINGWDLREPIPTESTKYGFLPQFYTWAKALREAENDPAVPVPSPAARVTSIWCPDEAEASRVARACHIERHAGTPEHALEGADAALVLTEAADSHLALARLAFERGLPTFVDKPLTPDARTSRELAALAESKGTPWFTASALRFSPSLRRFAAGLEEEVGGARAVYVQVAGPVDAYGIHALEVAAQIVPLDAFRVLQGFDSACRAGAFLGEESGRSVIIDAIQTSLDPPALAVVYGRLGHRIWVPEDTPLATLGLVMAFVEMARTGRPPFDPGEGLAHSLLAGEITAAAEAATRTPILAAGTDVD